MPVALIVRGGSLAAPSLYLQQLHAVSALPSPQNYGADCRQYVTIVLVQCGNNYREEEEFRRTLSASDGR